MAELEEQVRMIPLAVFGVLANDKQMTGKSKLSTWVPKTKTKVYIQTVLRPSGEQFQFAQVTIFCKCFQPTVCSWLLLVRSLLSVAPEEPIVWNSAPINPGGHFNTILGMYTAPSHGYYQ